MRQNQRGKDLLDFLQDRFKNFMKEKEIRNDYMEKEKVKLCYKCKVALKKTELKDVYKCIACGMITNERLDDRQPWEKPNKNKGF